MSGASAAEQSDQLAAIFPHLTAAELAQAVDAGRGNFSMAVEHAVALCEAIDEPPQPIQQQQHPSPPQAQATTLNDANVAKSSALDAVEADVNEREVQIDSLGQEVDALCLTMKATYRKLREADELLMRNVLKCDAVHGAAFRDRRKAAVVRIQKLHSLIDGLKERATGKWLEDM